MQAPVRRTPVLIAGAGVAGALTALELAHHGVPSLVVERARKRSRQADLLLISGRGLELLRRLGLADRVRAGGLAPGSAAEIIWGPALDRPPVLVWRLPSPSELRGEYAAAADGSAPIEPYVLISGPELIARLRRALRECPAVDLRTGWTLVDAADRPDHATATVIEAESGRHHLIEADYLVGCDGAQSTVRRCAGFAMEPFNPADPQFTVYFASAGVARRRDGPFAWITAGATVIAGHDGDRCVAQLPVGPGDEAVTDHADLVRRRLGLSAEPSEIQAVVQRDTVPAVARAYGMGRIFLAGQAAHPTDSPGDDVDTCIGDAVGLGWRLAAAVHGWAGAHLLHGYTRERRGRAVADRIRASRALATRGRFRRLVEEGADQQRLEAALRANEPRLDLAGTDPVALAGTPGHRLPAFRLDGGDQLFDRLGPQFTLVDLTGRQSGRPLVTAARKRGIPVRHLPAGGPAVPDRWPGRLLLVRPDQQVAWCSSGATLADLDDVLDDATGARERIHENT
ncbi:FAD-dependent monooxygenase [Actinoplanes subtropicus]|uniref:FAD-dependent monooxygenase n=1 Tax=Actinoplanes subtropicus TaxID=543632 RepID=UPI0004C4673A|nr:FAD-dependent monooxygenase [Actinoplanes subtropicus]